jgi:beta-lactamase class A
MRRLPRSGHAPGARAPLARRGSLALLCALGLALPSGPAAGQEPHLRQLAERFQSRLAGIAAEAPGVLGIQVVDLTSGQRFGVNSELVFPQGSSIKVPILLELYRQAAAGRVRLDERVPVDSAEMVGGTGVLNAFGDGTSHLALRDLGVLMIVLSDNTATNLLIDRLGMEGVNRLSAELGAPQTRLQRKMIRPRDSAEGRENLSTPAEAAALMARVARCALPVPAEACADLKRILSIPKTGALADAVPRGVPMAWKWGGIEGVYTVWGVVDLPGRPYVIAAMMNYAQDDSAEEWVRRAAEATHGYFSRLARASPHGTRVPLQYLRPPSSRNGGS